LTRLLPWAREFLSGSIFFFLVVATCSDAEHDVAGAAAGSRPLPRPYAISLRYVRRLLAAAAAVPHPPHNDSGADEEQRIAAATRQPNGATIDSEAHAPASACGSARENSEAGPIGATMRVHVCACVRMRTLGGPGGQLTPERCNTEATRRHRCSPPVSSVRPCNPTATFGLACTRCLPRCSCGLTDSIRTRAERSFVRPCTLGRSSEARETERDDSRGRTTLVSGGWCFFAGRISFFLFVASLLGCRARCGWCR
jgi:hypothetical protein